MLSPTSADEFLDLLRKSGVAEEACLNEVLGKLRTAGLLPADAPGLASLLIREGLLTIFQAEQLLQGKWRRFTIGNYLVLERLGSGSTGGYYLCQHRRMRRRLVAIKVLPTACAEDPRSVEGFYREARALASSDHPNLIRAYDINRDGQLHYLVMEFVDGADLHTLVQKQGPLDVTRASHYIRQAASGLGDAHRAGWAHRNIKPSKLLLDRQGVIKIRGMSLVRFFREDEPALAPSYDATVMGTADFMAPEQARGSAAVDGRADLYSLGLTFYFLLTGRKPFEGGTPAQKLIRQQMEAPRPLRSLRPEVPEPLATILEEKLLAKDPAARYQEASELIDALADWTGTPIAPPSEAEMPRFSPRVRALLQAGQ